MLQLVFVKAGSILPVRRDCQEGLSVDASVEFKSVFHFLLKGFFLNKEKEFQTISS